ncbi:hypothetical protein POM88_026606 [Heracleum sosnowskyi]|uniref:Aminotransferase class I/classII large domain-containing protein n=1 Tax=Heracleum sosnowskyi TaxID=360622 RepID=A0AAD8MP18_9APIA|nr:hypothetical protein POM88_026606 [Heracleum sosnowskyi]
MYIYFDIEVRHFNLLPENGWEVDLDSVEALADGNTVAIVIINPGNPCGNVFTHEHLKQLVESIKSYISISAEPPTFIQGALPQILEKTTNGFFSNTIDILKEVVDVFYTKLEEIPCLTCPQKPEGAMSCMVKLNLSLLEDIHDDMDFCIKLAKEESVIVLPGAAVGLKNWLRITFAVDPAALEDGLESNCNSSSHAKFLLLLSFTAEMALLVKGLAVGGDTSIEEYIICPANDLTEDQDPEAEKEQIKLYGPEAGLSWVAKPVRGQSTIGLVSRHGSLVNQGMPLVDPIVTLKVQFLLLITRIYAHLAVIYGPELRRKHSACFLLVYFRFV